MRKKTIQVSEVKEYCNNMMRDRGSDTIEEFDASFKMGVAYVLDYILNQTGNYKGYNYCENYNKENWNKEKEWSRKYY